MLAKDKFAVTPPMGWNSWDCYGAAVNEEQLLGNAEYIAKNLKQFGWEYVVCDIQWYEPTADSNNYHKFADLCMDEYSRVIPAPNRFPSGFAAIAEKIHSMGLKFGIHIMRGIPRQAVHRNTKIKGTDRTARDIAAFYSLCSWNTDMYGVDTGEEGAQEYYNSIFELYASWGVDYVKVDDASVTEFNLQNPYSAKEEIEMIRRAIDNCGRKIVFSLSPGPAQIENAEHLSQNANLWRMTGDFWDCWDKLYDAFERCENWNPFRKEGCWPDCDMLPLGKISKTCCCAGEQDRYTNFTAAEQKTLMNLWCIFRSPLMLGGELRENRKEDLELITNKELLDINQHSTDNRQLFRTDEEAAWVCRDKNGCVVLALFNLSDKEKTVAADLAAYGLKGNNTAVDIWTKEESDISTTVYSKTLSEHESVIVRIQKK